jgi:hypothetical protein
MHFICSIAVVPSRIFGHFGAREESGLGSRRFRKAAPHDGDAAAGDDLWAQRRSQDGFDLGRTFSVVGVADFRPIFCWGNVGPLVDWEATKATQRI